MKPLAALKLLAAFLSASVCLQASAATITVVNTNDAGAGSLRQAIASAAPGDTIGFAVTGTITLTSGQLLINKNLTIEGPDAKQLTVRRDTGGDYRIFLITSGVTANISGLTISNGYKPDTGPDVEGAGIFNKGGSVTLSNCVVSGNAAHFGSIANYNGGTLKVTGCSVTGEARGGGIFNYASTLTVRDSVISGNYSTQLGGGIFNGGSGIVTLTNSTVSGNSAAISGGGIYNQTGTFTITNSMISDNPSSQTGGIENGGTLTMTNSIVSGNSGSVGGMFNSGSASLTNCTISGNTGFNGGGFANYSSLTLTSVTVTNNRATGADEDGFAGGGIYNPGGAGLLLRNSIVAGNFRDPTGSTANDIDFGQASSTSSYNLIGTGGAGGLTDGGGNHNQVGVANPGIGALAGNGGPTKTHAPLPGSPAIDVGSNALAVDANGNPLTTDQRGPGFPRIFGPAVDIGAYEYADTDGDGVEDFRDNCPTTPNPEKIAFASVRDGIENIYVMNADGSNEVRLTNEPVRASQPSFSRNGSKIAFISRNNDDTSSEVYVMNADGSNKTRLTNDGRNAGTPAFSPDGSKIAYSSSGGGSNYSHINVMNADGSNLVSLPENNTTNSTPTFSPDGSKIAFRSVYAGNEEIFLMNVDGTNRINLTNNGAHDTWPAFSPDGSKIAFTSLRDGNAEIYVMNADGSNQTRLTYDGRTDFQPSFSPDGSKITFASSRGGPLDVYVMNADGSNVTRVTNNTMVNDSNPSWGAQADSDGDGIGDACENTAPTIMAASGVTRQQGGGGAYLSIATVNDAQDAATALSVTVNGSASASANGVTISNITVDASGNVTANVAAACGASNAAFTLRVTDSGALSAEAPLNVAVTTETTPPVITLTGANPMTVQCHAAFTDPGATANDNCAGSVPVTASGSVNANTPGSYTLTYNAVDPSGNPAAPVTRTVNVVDTAPPVITLNGASIMSVECSATFTDPGASANDTCAGNLTSEIVRTGSVNPSVPGTYTLTYNAQDPSGNPAVTVTRTVNVMDTTAPVITAVTANPGTLWPADNKLKPVTVAVSATDCGAFTSKITSVSFLDPGKGDKEDEAGKKMKPAVQITGDLSVNLLAGPKGRVYTITVTCTDSAGNAATKTTSVTVAPPPPPPPRH